MPELPEVETVRRGLEPVLTGRRLARLTLRRADLRVPFPHGLSGQVAGRLVVALRRRAKYLLLDLEGDLSLILHLGMSGRIVVWPNEPPPPEPHDHVDIATSDGVLIRFRDPRRFGLLLAHATSELDSHPLFARLGPEPLDAGFDGPALESRLAGRRTPIKAALLDQTVVAGLGNIYVCESLFRARLSPQRLADTVRGRSAGRLAAAIRDVLTDAVAAGGSSLRDHRRTDGELGEFQLRFAVYDREGQPCPGCTCDLAETGGIRRIVQAGRSTFYCLARQH